MLSYVFVGLGGAMGAIARVALSRFLPATLMNLPFKIILINAIGCFVLGLLTETSAFFWTMSDDTRHFLFQGLLGGFTTFSAFALEFGLLANKGAWALALFYVGVSILLGFFCFFGGLRLIRLFI